jgi:hypothetical protein
MNQRVAHLLVVLSLIPAFSFAPSRLSTATAARHQIHQIFSKDDSADKLLESAQRLRDEAQLLESQLGERRPIVSQPYQEKPVSYQSLKDSIWTLTYRFSSEPPPKDDEDPISISSYSGKVIVKFLGDGYSELIRHEPSGNDMLSFEKIWGWDEEVSTEDEYNYVLFSASIKLSPSDVSVPNQTLRYYWQARIDKGTDNALSLADGTVTAKKDLQPPGGFWGFFRASGILAQFRYVGNFVAKPTSP